MKTKFLAPLLAATFALAVVACDDPQNEASTDTSTGQSGGSAPNTVAGTGTTSNAGRTTGTSGNAPIGAPEAPLPPAPGTAGTPVSPSTTGASPPGSGVTGGGGPTQ
ncbi:hypothetical protein [Falsiroseomonas sp. E2-1-a20]|uniref:hypothetical protein n=1 Tax=Falsiroseomonas sp. E2-1-a20 TaxID=3239300 RepID=UPI003F3501B5